MNTEIFTRAVCGSQETMTVDKLKEALARIEALPKNDEWIVIDPQGRMYKGKVEEVTRVLLAEHPLLKHQTCSITVVPNAK